MELGCGVDLLHGIRGTRAIRSSAAGSRHSVADSSVAEFALSSSYAGLRAEPRIVTSVESRVWRLEKSAGRVWKLRRTPQRLASGKKLLRWRAEGIQLPNPISFWDGVKNPLLEKIQGGGLFPTKQPEVLQTSEAEAETKAYFLEDITVSAQFPNGELSTAALDCVEQFSRLNGLSGKKMRSNFESMAPVATQSEARNFVEFACFRYLTRCSADLHPSLKDATFRRLTFTAMLAWQRPYKDAVSQTETSDAHGFPRLGLVGEQAFTRIAPAIAGAADCATAHYLHYALVGKQEGLQFDVWDRYCSELSKGKQWRDQQLEQEVANLGLDEGECIVFVNSDSRQPVHKLSKNSAWPGRLTLTERALYFEANGLTHHQKATRLDLTGPGATVERKRVGPFGLEVFDSAISVSSGPESEPWILEFVDFGGEGQLNVWLAIIKEIFAVYAFIAEYGVGQSDPLLNYVYGAKQGWKKARGALVLSIARLQAVQAVLGKLPAHSERLLQFSYLGNAPSGELVLQALAVSIWGGRLEAKSRDMEYLALGGGELAPEESGGLGTNYVGTDGTVYLRNWATSTSWGSGKSNAFWKGRPGHKGLVLGRNHVVGGLTQVERAVHACRDQTKQAEKTQATIDGALLKGIPPNLDLLQELLRPFSIAGENIEKLKRWENPGASVTCLFFVYGIIYMNWLTYVIPSLLLSGAAYILALTVLQTQGRLSSDFGKVTIREQPPTNTIEQIMALKEALSGLEDFLQTCNIVLLKLRTVALYREPRATKEVVGSLLVLGTAMLVVPFRYLLAIFIADQFTNELKFREKSVQEMFKQLGDWWSTIPAAPVVVLPPEKREDSNKDMDPQSRGEAVMEAMSEWLGGDSTIQMAGGTK